MLIGSTPENLLHSQETGLLFAEVCVKQAKNNKGRIGIILPNGYLGNRSNKYRIFREWLLRHTRLVGICSFPRFTFKSSGADVSASVLFLEKRKKPLKRLNEEDYCFFVELIEKVGWDAGNKKAAKIYQRNKDDGSFIVNDDGTLIIDSDFGEALQRIRGSDATEYFDWLTEGQEPNTHENSCSIDISEILKDPDLTIDPKRYCRKVSILRNKLTEGEHFKLGDILEFLPEKTNTLGEDLKIIASVEYNYIEISDIGYGDFISKKLLGWELPSRARHFVEEGDIYFGSIWGSVAKWCYVGKGYDKHIVTNGCHRCRLLKNKQTYLIDLIAYMNTEGWATQLRAMARGSDGLAEVAQDDVKNIIIPRIKSRKVRKEIEPFVENFKKGRVTVKSTVSMLIDEHYWLVEEPKKRPSHIVLV